MADENGRGSRNTLAIVSVLATAAVGLAASGTTLIVSRDERSTARANRIYERRAATYVDAIDTLEHHLTVLTNLDFSTARGTKGLGYEQVGVDDEKDRDHIRALLLAFGSGDVLAAFERVKELDANAFDLVIEGTPQQPSLAAWREKTDREIQDLRTGATEFEKRLNRELTS